MTPIMNNQFMLKGISYYKQGNKYYSDNSTTRFVISKKEWNDAVFEFYIESNKS